MRLLMVSTTGEHAPWYVLDDALVPRPAAMPDGGARRWSSASARTASRRSRTVLFLGGAGGSLRAGVTENPVLLTRAIKQALVNVTCGGAPAYVWPGGGITVMVDVLRMPDNSFGTVPTPAIVAPIEFSMRLDDYRDARRPHGPRALARARRWRAAPGTTTARRCARARLRCDPANPWPLGQPPMLG